MGKFIRIILFLLSLLAITLPNFIDGYGEVTGYNLTVTLNMKGIPRRKIEVSVAEDAIIVDFQNLPHCGAAELVHVPIPSARRFMTRKTCRIRFSLPAGIRPDKVQSNLNIHGKLIIKAIASIRAIPALGKIPINIVSQENIG